VSTRRVERLAEQLGVKSLSRSQVSEMATHLDAQVAAFRERSLDTFVWVDALVVKVREDSRVFNVQALIATRVNTDGHREIHADQHGLDVASAEDGAGWLSFCAGWSTPAGRGAAGDLRRPPRPRRGDRVGVARRGLAAVSHPLEP
jgi:putative transposase